MPPRRPSAEKRPPKDIIEFVTSDEYLGDKEYSPAQLSVLKAIYGLPMNAKESAAFLAMNEGRPPRKSGYDEASLGFGRRSGKGEKIGAAIVCYEAVKFDPTGLAPGETAWGIMVAQNEKQARIVRDYTEAKLRILEEKGFKVFEETVAQSKAVTAEVIRLSNRVNIACFPCKKVAVRGLTAVVVVLDEIGHWQLEENAYNADKEIVRAIRPTRLTLRSRGYKVPLLKISTPFDEVGVFHDDFKRRHLSKQLVLHEVATKFLNPAITEEELAKEQFEDPESFDREYLAKWGAGGEHKPFPREAVEACTDRGRTVLPPKGGNDHVAWIDAAFKRDTFPLGIGHLEGGEKVVIDMLRCWKPAHPTRPLNDKEVVEEIASLVKPYGIDRVHGDQFCEVPLRNEFARYGIGFIEKPVTEASKYAEYKNLIAAMRARLVLLPDQEDIRADLTGLQKKGKWIGAPKLRNRHDDISTVIRGIVFELLPMVNRIDLEAANAGAVTDRARLFKERGFPLPEAEDPMRLPTDFMAQVF